MKSYEIKSFVARIPCGPRLYGFYHSFLFRSRISSSAKLRILRHIYSQLLQAPGPQGSQATRLDHKVTGYNFFTSLTPSSPTSPRLAPLPSQNKSLSEPSPHSKPVCSSQHWPTLRSVFPHAVRIFPLRPPHNSLV